jgi:hypothetical protein
MPWVSEGDSARWVDDPVAEAAPDPAQSQAIVADWYRTYLGREPDASGLEAYTNAINAGASTESLVSSIVNSGEGQNYIAAQTSQNAPAMNSGAGRNPVTQEPQSGLNTEQVNQLYRRYLGREPDPSGMNTFRGMDMAQAISRIAGSQEFQDKQSAKQAAAGATGGVNWLIDPNNLAKNAVSWSDYYGQGQYHYADGSTALADPSSPNTAISITPPYSSYENPANMRLGYRNYAYAGSSVPDTVTINGVELPVQKPEYLINTQTGKVFTDPAKGNRTYTILDVTPANQSGELYKVFDSTVKIGAAVMASVAFAPVGMALLEAAAGMTAAELTAAYGAATINAAASAISAGTSSAVNTALQGGDINKILEATAIASATAGATSGITSGINAALPDNLPASVSSGIGKGAVGTVTAILGGKDPISGLARGTISGLAGGAVKDIQTRDINDFDLQGDDQVFDTEEQRYLTPYEVSVKYPELYPEGLPVEERTVGEKLAGTTATTLAGALSSYFFPSTKPSTGSTPTSGRTVTPSTGAKEVPRETSQTTARSPTPPMMATSGKSPATSSYFGPSTAALGQALRVSGESLAPAMAGGGGGDGSTGQEISEESGAAPKKKWVNAQSLRDLDEIGS